MFGMEQQGRQRRRFGKEFKADVVRLVRDGNRSVEDVAHEHRIHPAFMAGCSKRVLMQAKALLLR